MLTEEKNHINSNFNAKIDSFQKELEKIKQNSNSQINEIYENGYINSYSLEISDDVLIKIYYKINNNELKIFYLETFNYDMDIGLKETTDKYSIKNAGRYTINKILEIADKNDLNNIIFISIMSDTILFYEKIVNELKQANKIKSFNFYIDEKEKKYLSINT